MENFQIVEEVGKGRNSCVYKGREKGRIEFVALKSVSKEKDETKKRIANAVRRMSSLTHVNVLTFFNW